MNAIVFSALFRNITKGGFSGVFVIRSPAAKKYFLHFFTHGPMRITITI